MVRADLKRWMLAGAAVCAFHAAPGALAQAYTPPPPPILNSQQPPAKKCKATKTPCPDANAAPDSPAPAGSAAQDNPFPEDDSKHGLGPDGLPAGGAQQPKPSADNPFPDSSSGKTPDPPASSNAPRKMPPSGIDDGSSAPRDDSSSSSSSGDDAPAAPPDSSSKRDDDEDVAPTTAAPNSKVKPTKLKDLGSSGSFSEAHAKLERTRVADDLKVAKFYLQDGNAQGAYLRYKDAVEHDPENSDARFGLAEAAAKLKKRDEAIASYQQTLQMDPGGDHEKAAQKGLETLGAK